MVYAMTAGTAKALTYSGEAMGLVLKGTLLMMSKYYKVNDQETIDDNNDTILQSYQGLLVLFPDRCPIKSKQTTLLMLTHSSPHLNNDDWEKLNVDLDLSTRIAGCFHMAWLELVDIPLQCLPCTLGGITLGAFQTVLQSCPGMTHLSLADWANSGSNVPPRLFQLACEASEDVSFLLSGTASTLPHAQTWTANSREQLGQYGHDHYSDAACDIMGLHELLLELRMLDISSCRGITPIMIFRFLS